MVLLRPLTGRLGMRRKPEWLGGVDVTRGRGWTGVGALHTACTVWGTISRMEIVSMVLLRPLTGRLGMRRKPEWQGGVDVTRGRGGSVREHCTSMHCVDMHGAPHSACWCNAPSPIHPARA